MSPHRPRTLLAGMRRARGLSQSQAAARLGVQAMTVSRWERGAVTPPLPTIVALARLYRVRLELAVRAFLDARGMHVDGGRP